MKKGYLILALPAVLLFFSCKEEAVPSAQEEVDDMLNNDQETLLEDSGMVLHTGDDPPDITNPGGTGDGDTTYVAEDLDCIVDTTGLYLENLYYYFRFYNLNTDNTISLDYTNNYGTDTASGVGAYILGQNSSFTVYAETSGESGGISYRTVSAYTGTLTSSGITGLKYAFIMTWKSDDPYGYLMGVDEFRIYEEGDGLLEYLDTYPGGLEPGPQEIRLHTAAGGD